MTGTARRLILLRHAKSAWPDGIDDVERPLTDRGRQDAPAAGRWLAEHVDHIDLVLCSPAIRARETWELAAGELDPVPEVRYEDRIYGASPGDLLTATQQLPEWARTAVFVGHNPGLEHTVVLLSRSRYELKTAAIVVLGSSGPWEMAAPGWAKVETAAKPRG